MIGFGPNLGLAHWPGAKPINRAVDYIQLKCVKQYNKKEPLTEKYRVQLLEFETDATTLQ